MAAKQLGLNVNYWGTPGRSKNMEVIAVPIDQLVFDPANARKHSEKNLAAIKGSLAKFGQQKPLVVDKNNVVIAGNGTLAAAKQLGWAEVDIVRTELTGTEAIAFALADNRTSELAEWDDDVLAKTLQGLSDDAFDIGAIGFDAGIFDVSEIAHPDLGMEESKDVCQMTFVIHVDQKQAIDSAIERSKKDCGVFPGNENKNGNALHRICLEWLKLKTS